MSELSVIIKAVLEADEAASSAKIRGQIPSIEAALKGSPIKVPIEVDTAKVSESAARVRKGFDDALKGKSSSGSVLDPGMVKNVAAQYELLMRKVKEFQSAFSGSMGKLSLTSITQDAMTGNHQALLQYQTGLGKMIQYMMQLEQATQKVSVKQLKYTDQIAKAEAQLQKQTAKAEAQRQKQVEASANFKQQQLSSITKLESQAYNQKNPLDKQFGAEFEKAKGVYSAFVHSLGDDITKEQRRIADWLRETAKLSLEEGKAAQYGATDYRSRDITQEKATQENALRKLIADAKSANQYTGDMRTSIDALGTSLQAVSDAPGLEKWLGTLSQVKSELAAVKAEAQAFAQSTQGLAQAQAASIQNGQLAQVQTLLQNPTISTASTSGITALRTELNALGTEYQRIVNQMNTANISDDEFQQLNQQVKELEPRLKSAANVAKQFDGSLKSSMGLEKMASQIEQAKASLNSLEGNWSAFKKNPALVAEFDQLKLAAQDLDAVNFGNFQKQMGTFRAHVKESGLDMRSLGDELKNNLSKFTQWFGASTIIMQTMRVGKDVVQNVKAIDTSMTDLRKVTDATEQQYDSFLSNSAKRSVDLSTELSSLIDATSIFGRLGYDLDTASKLGEVATIYANVGDNVGGIENASGSIISALKAFDSTLDQYGSDADKALAIVDKFNEVGNRFAVSSGDLGVGLRNSASALAFAGNDIDQSIAMIAAMTEITQDASESGKQHCPAA